MSGVIFDPLLGQLRTSDAGGGTSSPLTTKGDIYTYSTTNTRLPVGVDGTVLSADSSQTTGLKWIAAGGTGTVTSVSVTTTNGVSGTVANATTTPAISLTLGAITPTSINSVVLSGSSTPTLVVTGTASISGVNTGDQTIVLTGDVTGSGTGSFATTIKSSVSLAGSPTTTTQAPADNSTKIATTSYVDNAVLGQNFKEAVGAATTANLVGTYLNGASGVGATFTYTATGVDTIDGVSLTLGMRVLVKNQTTAFQNGIYTVTTAGAIGIAGILTRAADADQTTDWKTGDSTFVTAGTTQSTTTWAYTGIDSPTMGTTSLTFAQTAGQGSFTAGNGIAITGNSIALISPVTVANGGTNATSASITAFNNITGYSASGSTGTTSTNIVFSTSPTLITPALGTPSALVGTNITGTGSSFTSGITQALASATTTVNVSSATAPSSGQVLTATSSTTATWQTPSSGGFTWNNVTGTTQVAAINNGYIANNASLVTVTLPSTAGVGSVVEIAGSGAGGWKLAQNASQLVNFGTSVTTTGTGGSLASVNRYDAVRLICIVTNTTWSVISSQGNVTVV
jgi:hypothetical protein